MDMYIKDKYKGSELISCSSVTIYTLQAHSIRANLSSYLKAFLEARIFQSLSLVKGWRSAPVPIPIVMHIFRSCPLHVYTELYQDALISEDYRQFGLV